MITIVPYHLSHQDEAIDFIARLNEQPIHHVGYLGDNRAEVVQDLDDLTVPIEEGLWLAMEGDEIVGALGYDADSALGKVWLIGPFADSAHWLEVAEPLYTAVLEALPVELDQLELFGHVENTSLANFARDHGYTFLSPTHAFRQSRPATVPLRPEQVLDFEQPMAADLATLHDSLFPNTYYSAAQLIEMIDSGHQLLTTVKDGRLSGYAFVRHTPSIGYSYLDFLGVADGARQQGLGRALLDAVSHEAYDRDEITHLDLTVHGDNDAAIHLYASAGFELLQTMRGYRRRR